MQRDATRSARNTGGPQLAALLLAGLLPEFKEIVPADPSGERLVLVVELRDERKAASGAAAVAVAVRAAVIERHSIGAWGVIVGKAGTVAKTTNGKFMRRPCRDALLSGEMERSSGTLHVARGE